MKKLCSTLILCTVFFTISGLLVSNDNSTTDRLIYRTEVYNELSEIGYVYDFEYIKPYYSKHMLLNTVRETYTDKVFRKYNHKYEINYDNNINPCDITYYDEKGNKLKTIIFEYDKDIARYPFSNIAVFEFYNLKAYNKLRLKKVINHKDDTEMLLKYEYKNDYLVKITEYKNHKEYKKHKFIYNNQNNVYIIKSYEGEFLYEKQIFIYEDLRKDNLQYCLITNADNEINNYYEYKTFSNGNIHKKILYDIVNNNTIENFNPYTINSKIIETTYYRYK